MIFGDEVEQNIAIQASLNETILVKLYQIENANLNQN
jgi:hypothetical protein